MARSAFGSRLHQELERRRAHKGPTAYEEEIAASREACRNFHEFVRQGWHVLEPVAPFVDGKIIGAICEHLVAVHELQILRLLMNVPPGSMKSLLTSVFFQAWEWGPMGRPDLRTISTSYSGDFAKRDSRKTLALITSPWFQARWGAGSPSNNPVILAREGEMSFANTAMGTRDAKPFASLTGGRGDRLIIDDPHSTETAESEAERDKTIRTFREDVPDRINNPKTSAIIVIMQRLNKGDVSGEIERLGLPYERLIMPMEFEIERACATKIGFHDWRTQDGELLWPERFDREWIDAQKVAKGSYAIAAQYQQRPTAREGGMFKRHWFKIVKAVPANVRGRVRRWDFAGSVTAQGSDPDYTSGVKMCAAGGNYYVENVKRFREVGAAVRIAVQTQAGIDGRACHILLAQDPGQAGKEQAASYIAMLAGYVVRAERETGSKEVRAEPYAAQCEAGNVYLVEGPWNEAYIDEMCSFPAGHDDQVDASSGAFNYLARNKPLVISDAVLARARA